MTCILPYLVNYNPLTFNSHSHFIPQQDSEAIRPSSLTVLPVRYAYLLEHFGKHNWSLGLWICEMRGCFFVCCCGGVSFVSKHGAGQDEAATFAWGFMHLEGLQNERWCVASFKAVTTQTRQRQVVTLSTHYQSCRTHPDGPSQYGRRGQRLVSSNQ